MQLKRSATGHIDPEQAWHVKSVDGETVYIKMGGGSNSFAHKHLMSPSKQDGVTDDTKALRRLWHRVDKGGTHGDNPDPGGKKSGAGVMSRGNKYGDALSMKTRKGVVKPASEVKNSVICLSLHDLDSVLVDMAKALTGWDGSTTKIPVKFAKACVKTVDLAGHVTGPIDSVEIEAHKITNGYEVTHLFA
ncbi:MAG: hypothetical protein QM742_12135 [Aquabacterium sp.]